MPTPHDAIREHGSRDDDEALRELAAAAQSSDQFLRRTALEAIGNHPKGRVLEVFILKAFDDPSEYVVRTACEIVERWQLEEAHDALITLLLNASAATRRSAIRALDAVWIDADFSQMFGIFTKDAEAHVCREAAWVLRKHAGPGNWRTLFNAFSSDELARHRQWACELASQFSGPELLPLLSTLSLDVEGHVRKVADHAVQIVSNRA